MRALCRLAAMALITALSGLLCTASMADPATPRSERVAKYGSWSVVKKPSTYIIAETGQTGRHSLCSAAYFAENASLELQATNDRAWSVYVAAQGWNFSYGLKSLTIKSGAQQIHIPQAVYHGPMISAASHFLGGGKPVSIAALKALIAQGQPISIHDGRGRKLVTFPNDGSDLSAAFNRAIKCSLANQP
jgi:hypothetical protein